MRSWAVTSGIAALVIFVVTSVGANGAQATISGSGMCWVPDWEFPIPCADMDED